MDDPKDTVLSFALRQIADDHAKNEAIMAAVAKVKIEKQAKAKAPKAPKKEKPIVPPFVPTLNAVSFLVMVHDAGTMEGPNGSKIPRPMENRNGKAVKSDEQLAIEAAALKGYCGYSKSAPHGTQLDVAVRRARATIRPDLLRDKPKSDPSIKGFVAGAADHAAKGLANLLARETLAVSRMAECEAIARMHGAKDASDAWHKFYCAMENKDPSTVEKPSDSEARKLAEGFSLLEFERLVPIREELRAMGYYGEHASPPLTGKIQVSWTEEPIEENASE